MFISYFCYVAQFSPTHAHGGAPAEEAEEHSTETDGAFLRMPYRQRLAGDGGGYEEDVSVVIKAKNLFIRLWGR